MIAIVLLLAFVFHNQIIRVISRFTQVLFFLGFLGMLSVAFFSDAYTRLVDGFFDASHLGQQLQDIDSSLNQMDEATTKWQEQWDSFWGAEEQEEMSQEPMQLYPSFLMLLSTGLMVVVGAFSLVMMLLSIYFKYTFLGYMSANRGLRRIEKLENSARFKLEE